MSYYEMLQDTGVSYTDQLGEIEWVTSDRNSFGFGSYTGNSDSLPDLLLHRNEFYASVKLKEVLEMYTIETTFHSVVLSNFAEEQQLEYYLIQAPKIEALGDGTTYLRNGWVDQPILSRKKIGEYMLFDILKKEQSTFASKHLYMNIDLVESILRRRLWGMVFKEMDLEE